MLLLLAAVSVDHDWSEGDLCAVYSAEENQWYRAEVATISAHSTPTKKKPGFLSRLLTKKEQGAESCKYHIVNDHRTYLLNFKSKEI